MPPVNGPMWRTCREEMDITSDHAASLLDITGGALRQIELGRKPASGRLAARAARLYHVATKDLLQGGDQPEQPNNEPARVPKKEPKIEPTAPPARRGNSGPRRAVAS